MDSASNKILVVDDDPGIRQALGRLLGAAGFPVGSFDSGEALLASGEASTAGAFVLDVQLPGMNGLELHDLLQTEAPGTSSIFITGQAGTRHLDRILELGVPCFSKPFQGHDLIAAIRDRIRLSPNLPSKSEITTP